MKLNYYKLFFIIFLFLSSCTNFGNLNDKNKKVDLSNNNLEKLARCPNHFIPEETRYFLNKKNEKVLRLGNVKLDCKYVSNTKNIQDQKILISQVIYYEVLQNKLNLNHSKSFVYLALVDDTNNSIKNKILIQLQKKPLKKIGDKIYIKDVKTFKIKSNKDLTFYYGFQR